MSFPTRQYDIPRTGNFHVTLPIVAPYRINATDFVFFNYSNDFPVNNYKVIVESASVASPNINDRFRDIGPLENKCELPNVYFSRGFESTSSILVLPKQHGQGKSYIGNLVRGATYNINPNGNIMTQQGHIGLERSGGLY